MRLITILMILFANFYVANLSAQVSASQPRYEDKVIIAKGDKQFAPFEFINDKGELDGFSVDLFKALMSRLNLKYTLTLEDWGKVQKELRNKQIDVAIGMIYSAERAQNVRFGIPHCMMSYNLICNKENDFVDLKSLQGREVIVQNNDRAHEYLLEQKLTDKIIVVDNIKEAVKLLAQGKHDAVLSFDMSSVYFIKEGKYDNLLIHPSNIEPERYAIVVNTDNEDLLYMLNAALYQMKIDGEYDNLYYKWFGVYEEPKVSNTVWYILAILVACVVTFAFFNYMLSVKVDKSTLDLKKKNEETLKLVDDLKKENKMRLETEKSLVEAKEKAVESDRLKSAFLANMSHEIRTPLNAIIGFSNIVCETEDKEDKEQYRLIIEQNNELLLQLINDILDLSRIESGILVMTKDNFRVKDLCEHVLLSVNKNLHLGNAVIASDIEFDCTLNSDRSRIIQVINNFMNNALKFTYSGTITLRTQAVAGNMVEISVVDTGMGIEEDKIKLVFERFTKLNQFIQGTGLGLSICQNIVERLGGEIGVESEVGVGSKFWVKFPIEREA